MQRVTSLRSLRLCEEYTKAYLKKVLCSLLPLAQAGGSWLVDGQAVQSLKVQTTNADPNALYTDGSRKMTAPLRFDSSASVPNSGPIPRVRPPFCVCAVFVGGWYQPKGLNQPTQRHLENFFIYENAS